MQVFAGTWVVNKDHSEIQFQVKYLGLSEVSGRFKNFSGRVNLNDNQVPTEIIIKVDTATVDTGNSLRDGHLKANDFFQSQVHPFIVFQSQSITPSGPASFKAVGLLTVKDITKPFNIEFSLSETVKDTWNYQNKFVKFKSRINRKDFNMKWNKTLDEQQYLVGDMVNFWGTFQIQPTMNKTPSSKHMLPDTAYIREREKVGRGEIPESIIETDFPLASETKLVLTPTKTEVAQSIVTPDNYRGNIWWWVSLWVIGLLGFFAVIIVAFYSKNVFSEYFPRNYEENGILGYISDLLVIFFVILYSLAFWFLGWGVR
jgi:polyisoprenoid-binding protein YceI